MSRLLDRRTFIRDTSTTLGLVPFLAPLRVPGRGGAAPDWVEAARRVIPATQGRYFQTAGIAPSPEPVIARVQDLLEYQNQGPVHPNVSRVMGELEPTLRAALGRAFGALPEEVALTHSTSEGINIASWALDWSSGDEVVISNQEHPANTIPWYNLATRFGVRVRRADLATGTDVVAEVEGALTPRTRMVSLPHVSRNNGRRLRDEDVHTLADLLRGRGVRFHLDGAQGPGCVPVDFAALGCDYYSGCGHKWLLGPKGTGMFFCRRDVLDQTALTWTGSHSTVSYDQDGGYELIPEARRFEFGTRALADFGGFLAALEWMERVGMDRILARVNALVAYAEERWRSRGFRVTSPTDAEERSGVFVVELPPGKTGYGAYEELMTREATYVSPVDAPADLRIAIHFFNTEEEIEETLALLGR